MPNNLESEVVELAEQTVGGLEAVLAVVAEPLIRAALGVYPAISPSKLRLKVRASLAMREWPS